MLWMKLFLQPSSVTYLSPDSLPQLLVPVASIPTTCFHPPARPPSTSLTTGTQHQHLKSTSISHVRLSPQYFTHLCDRLCNMGQYEDRWYLVLGSGSTVNQWGLLASAGSGWEWMLACAGENESERSCVIEVGGGEGRWRQWSLLVANGMYWWKSVTGEGSWGYL